jgi:hypothetical protein
MAWHSGQTTRRSITAAALALISGWAHAQTVATTSGGSVRTALGRGITLNKGSSLERIWMTVHDPDMPVVFKNPIGVKTIYTLRDGIAGEYEYSAVIHLTASQAISAVEMRFLLFDIWGQNTKSLVMTEIADLAPGTTKELNPKWKLSSETEVAQHYASIAYISRVRTQDGRVLSANTDFVFEQARRFSAQFKEVDPEPKKTEAIHD